MDGQEVENACLVLEPRSGGDELGDDLVELLAAMALVCNAILKMQELNYPQHSELRNDLGAFRMMLKHYVELEDDKDQVE